MSYDESSLERIDSAVRGFERMIKAQRPPGKRSWPGGGGLLSGGGDAGVQEGRIAYLFKDLPAAQEREWSTLSSTEKDYFPADIKALYETNGGTVLLPGSAFDNSGPTLVLANGELARIIDRESEAPTDAAWAYPVARTFDENINILNTVKQRVSGNQFVQIKGYDPDTLRAYLDLAQCANTGAS